MLPKFNILYSAQNPNGKYLEEALAQIKEDVTTKNALLTDLTDVVSQNYTTSNEIIMELLTRAIEQQEEALAFAKMHSATKHYVDNSGSEIEACPMTYHEYLSFVGRKVFGDNNDGYYVTRDRGTPYMTVCWVCDEMLNENYHIVE